MAKDAFHHDLPAYRKAYKDTEFLTREELRPFRLGLELMKPELLQDEQGVTSTIVVFGGARIPDEEAAAERVRTAEAELSKAPDNADAQLRLRIAKNLAAKTRYYDAARELARLVSSSCQIDGHCDFVVVTGGGPGIMEAGNRGASDVAAKSIALNIELPFEQRPNEYITPELCFNFHYFAIRKMHFLMRAKALACFPGGFGTLDELFETLTLIQTKKIAPVPLLLFGKEFWSRLVDFEFLVEEGTISPDDLELFEFVETAAEAWEKIVEFYGIDVPPAQ